MQPRVHKHSESLSSSSHRTVLFFRCHFATTLSSPSTSFHTLPVISHLPIPLLLVVPLVDWRIDHPFLYHLHRYCYFNFYRAVELFYSFFSPRSSSDNISVPVNNSSHSHPITCISSSSVPVLTPLLPLQGSLHQLFALLQADCHPNERLSLHTCSISFRQQMWHSHTVKSPWNLCFPISY